MFLIAVIATVLAFVQNTVMFSLGLKEMAIFAFPFSFLGFFLAEVGLTWGGYFCVRRFVPRKRQLVLAGWVAIVLAGAEPMLPASAFRTFIQQSKRERVLRNIEQAGSSIEPLSSDAGGLRFALTYTLTFPRKGHYLTFPAYLGPDGNRVFGNYFTKLHPEYFDENYVFDEGKPYSFTVVFDTEGKHFDFSKDKANIDICDGKDYFMACRIIGVGLEAVPTAFETNPPVSGRREPAVPADNLRDITEKSIRLDELKLNAQASKTGQPIEFSFVITNAAGREIPIPGSDLASVIGVNYAWEAVSDGAKRTKVTPGIVRFGNAVAAGGAQFTSIRCSDLKPHERVDLQDKIAPFEPLAPGDYRLHVYLFSRYATELSKPEQELVQPFSIAP